MAPAGQPVFLVGSAAPWYRNQLFAATIGATLLAWANGHWQMGLPTDGTVGLAIGLGVMWGLHTILLDLQALNIANRPIDQSAAAFAKWLDQAMPGIIQALLAALGANTPTQARTRPQGQLTVLPGAKPPAEPPPEPGQPTNPPPS